MRVNYIWSLVFIALTIAAFFFYRAYQPALSYDYAEAFDGNDYRLAYEYFTEQNQTYEVPPPFHQRILVPLLAAIFDNGLITDFQTVNMIFSILSIYLLFILWRQLGLEFKWMAFGMIWLIFHWTGLIRLNAFDPITIDVPIYFFQSALLIFLFRRKFKHLIWLAPLATMQKESFIGYMIVFTIYALWHNRKFEDGYFELKPLVLACLLALATKVTVGYFFPPQEAGRGALIMIAYQARQVLSDPFELVRWLAAIGMAFGPVLWIALSKQWRILEGDAKHNLLLVGTALSLAYGLLAGGDMTRITFLGFPFVMSYLLLSLQRMDFKHFYWLAFLSLPLMMLHSEIPDPAFQWNLWQQWYPEFTDPKSVLLVLGYTLLMSSILIHISKRPAHSH